MIKSFTKTVGRSGFGTGLSVRVTKGCHSVSPSRDLFTESWRCAVDLFRATHNVRVGPAASQRQRVETHRIRAGDSVFEGC